MDAEHGTQAAAAMLEEAATEEAAAAAALGIRRVGTMEDLQCTDQPQDGCSSSPVTPTPSASSCHDLKEEAISLVLMCQSFKLIVF